MNLVGALTRCVNVASPSPSYITRNRLGIFYFQKTYLDPEAALAGRVNRKNRRVIRKSLQTRDRREALDQSKYWWLIMVEIHKKYFKNPESYQRAMGLVAQYESVKKLSWAEAEKFLETLEEADSKLLEKGLLQEEDDKKVDQLHFQANYDKSKDDLLKNSPLVSTAIQEWLEAKKKKLAHTSFISANDRIKVFHEILTEVAGREIHTKEISSEILRKVVETLEKIPAIRRGAEIKAMKYSEMFKLTGKKISNNTYLGYIIYIKEFIEWGYANDIIDNAKLSSILLIKKKNTPKEKETKKLPFTRFDLKTIFQHKDYLTGKQKEESDYWLPLISLYTGGRLGEIAQLLTSDIKHENGIHFISFIETPDDDESEEITAGQVDNKATPKNKHLKNKSGSIRVNVIHQDLIELGLLEYVLAVKKKGFVNLFPNVSRREGKYGTLQKRMATDIKHCKFKLQIGTAKTFHSFRHTIRTELVEIGIDSGLIDSMIGHSSAKRSVGDTEYTHTDRLAQKRDANAKVDFGVDIKSITHWTKCVFASKFL